MYALPGGYGARGGRCGQGRRALPSGVGIEPTAAGFSTRRSTTELPRRVRGLPTEVGPQGPGRPWWTSAAAGPAGGPGTGRSASPPRAGPPWRPFSFFVGGSGLKGGNAAGPGKGPPGKTNVPLGGGQGPPPAPPVDPHGPGGAGDKPAPPPDVEGVEVPGLAKAGKKAGQEGRGAPPPKAANAVRAGLVRKAARGAEAAEGHWEPGPRGLDGAAAPLCQSLELQLRARGAGEAGCAAPGGPGVLDGLGPAPVGVVIGVGRYPADPGAPAEAAV